MVKGDRLRAYWVSPFAGSSPVSRTFIDKLFFLIIMSNNYLNAISSADNNVFVDIEVSPNSNKFQISGFNEWRNRFEIRIKQVPQKGKANKEIVKELSKIFNCDVSISKGEKSSQKTIVCYNVSIEDILDKLGEIL